MRNGRLIGLALALVMGAIASGCGSDASSSHVLDGTLAVSIGSDAVGLDLGPDVTIGTDGVARDTAGKPLPENVLSYRFKCPNGINGLAGAKATMEDADGEAVGSGKLDEGIMESLGTCRYKFSITVNGNSDSYTLSIAGPDDGRPPFRKSFTADELDQQDWVVSLKR
jgi:hypothetical protein